ncbi:uncharacterized protein LOC111606694 [Xiphophorus maculatus]|uniref:uncharacterized protein LOC111606294 n=1 Tax=Xiphophorus maculatus TaxID=8083 RepID=UPI000C6D12BA|nr:uncharacterized protein LOC111606294 [Xiphophorus maculatus]XP_023183606.1 uncharacterized protein LOC111606694 [Xiphophorus maculatus]
MDQTRQARRLQKLKAHHNKCEAHHKKLVTKATNEVRENTSFLHQKGLMSKQSSDESDDTIILGPTPTEGDMSVPELTRTDSVILNKQMLCYSEASLSSSDITEEEYVPDSEESESDSLNDSDSSVDVKQLKKRKKRAQKNTSSLETLNEAKWNAPQLIPFAEDVRKMHQYLDTKRMECQRNLKEEAVKKNWAELAKITLCEVIIFNRRREGEVSKMPLNAFTLRDTSVTHPDVELALSELEKKLCKHFQRIEIKGKRGRKVPILLAPNMASSMELLVQNRRNCDVLDENPYMFGRPQTLNHFRGSDIIREMAQNCGAKHPGALSSTKLRKHMATMSKVLNLKDNEMDDLADFLGHDIRVHRQYYRLPEGTLQLAKISKVLLALERGQLSHFEGRNLDEISIDPQEKMSVDSGSDTEEEVDSAERDAGTSSSRSPDVDGNKKVENGQFGVTRRCTTEVGQSNDLPSAKERSDDEVLADMEVSGNSNTTNGPPQKKRLKWNQEEIQAVEKTLMDCIDSGKVPGKAQCMKCIETSPVALKDRTWQGIKFYVKNRIDALKRETFKRR